MAPSYAFADRQDAGRKLAAALQNVDLGDAVVVALPRGGVPVAEQICKAYQLPLDLVFVRKIGAPGHQELAVGAIVDGDMPQVVINHQVARSAGLTDAQVETMGQDLLPEIARRRAQYLKGLQRPSLANKILVVVDDGVATGATLRASLRALRKTGAKRIILALPTAPPDMLPSLAKLADQTICLDQPRYFHAVGAAYGRFDQTTDAEVVAALQRCAVWQQGT